MRPRERTLCVNSVGINAMMSLSRQHLCSSLTVVRVALVGIVVAAVAIVSVFAYCVCKHC